MYCNATKYDRRLISWYMTIEWRIFRFDKRSFYDRVYIRGIRRQRVKASQVGTYLLRAEI
jgi:hypothetical protein